MVELGAGKGHLTLMLARYTESRAFVASDIRTFQLKADRHVRRLRDCGDKPLRFLRCLCDLKDFVVAGALKDLLSEKGLASVDVAAVQQRPHGGTPPAALAAAVGVGKHLCGVATDFALRALLEHNPTVPLAGICIAPCCHFRCSWRAYVGKKTMLELGFSPRDFEIISWMASAHPSLPAHLGLC